VVLEARPKTGGAATTEAPWPDAPEFRVTRLSYVMSPLPPTIIRDLQLARHGYKVFPMGPYYQAFSEGGSIKLYADDAKRNYDEVSRWSKKDAEAMPRWDAWLAGLADVLGPLLLTVPPNLGSRKPRDLRQTLRLAWRHRNLDVRTIADVTRLMTMSIADRLDDWFATCSTRPHHASRCPTPRLPRPRTRPGGSAGRLGSRRAASAARTCSTCCATTASRRCAPWPPRPRSAIRS
jgi:phytoene dehydrogenase-like protein